MLIAFGTTLWIDLVLHWVWKNGFDSWGGWDAWFCDHEKKCVWWFQLCVISIFSWSHFWIGVLKNCVCFLSAEFQSGEPDLYVEAASKPDCESWAVALGEANSEGLQNKIQQLRRLIMEIKEERSSDEARQFLPSSQIDSLGEPQFTSKRICSFYWVVQ